MLTDKRIKDMAYEYCEGADELEYRDLIDFAHKLLAEVKLEDLLKRENEFLMSNKKSLIERLGVKGMGYSAFCEDGLVVFIPASATVNCLEWQDYLQWKASKA